MELRYRLRRHRELGQSRLLPRRVLPRWAGGPGHPGCVPVPLRVKAVPWPLSTAGADGERGGAGTRGRRDCGSGAGRWRRPGRGGYPRTALLWWHPVCRGESQCWRRGSTRALQLSRFSSSADGSDTERTGRRRAPVDGAGPVPPAGQPPPRRAGHGPFWVGEREEMPRSASSRRAGLCASCADSPGEVRVLCKSRLFSQNLQDLLALWPSFAATCPTSHPLPLCAAPNSHSLVSFFLSFNMYLDFAHIVGKVKDVKSIYFSFLKASSDAADTFEGNLP